MPYTTALITPTASTPHRPLLSALLCACICLCVFSAAPEAHAARKKTTHSDSAPAQKKGSVKIKQHRGFSQETTAERDRRMYRECWGRPNAGACLGYTRR